MLHAIIFDFDGTILETETPDYQSWQELFHQHGCELPLDAWMQTIGTVSTAFDPYQLLEDQLGAPLDRPAVRHLRRQRYHELVAQQPLRPGIELLIAAAQEQGIPLAVASSSTREWVEGHLTARNLHHYFTVIRTANDVRQVKPDPELYLAAVTALNATPAHTLAIEDSYNGLLAAKRAGLKCVVTPNAMTRSMRFAEADLVLESLEMRTLAQLAALFG